ncbi:protein FAM149A [Denticeps clupeoides]|uniref:protein FAM149A n=1 Tax=Denticeps clupeoides TaxID=299321 RepID=UPI0010A56CDE|nr:protein FAM149A [Denticeps clupeoides]
MQLPVLGSALGGVAPEPTMPAAAALLGVKEATLSAAPDRPRVGKGAAKQPGLTGRNVDPNPDPDGPWRRAGRRHPPVHEDLNAPRDPDERQKAPMIASLGSPALLGVAPRPRRVCDRCRLGSVGRDAGLIVIGKKLKEPGGHICHVPAHLPQSICRIITSDLSGSPGLWSVVDAAAPASRPTSSSGSPGCATGLSTEHSSIYSWRYDEFDRANTQHVRQLFCDVDELLYEGKVSSHSEGLWTECQEWNGHSPHLRILGNQLEPPKQEGFQYIRRTLSSRGVALRTEKREEQSELCVEGYRLALGCTASHAAFSASFTLSKPGLPSILDEEVFESEGRIEEFLAYDVKETEDEGAEQRKVCAALGVALRGGVPPVSPNECIKDAVSGELFDDVWQAVVSALERLLHKQWEGPSTGGPPRGTLEKCSLHEPPSQLHSRARQVPSSRGSNGNFLPGANCSFTQDSGTFKVNLNGVMTIQAKPLQQRTPSFTEKSLSDPDDRPSATLCGRPLGQRAACALSHKPPRQRRLLCLSSRARLLHRRPVDPGEVLRGTRLCMVSEGLLLPPATAALKQRFPHVQSEAVELQDGAATQPPRQAQPRLRFLRGGVVSAVHPSSTLPPLREPTQMLESRPNTTHTFWSDSLMKSSFSPADFASSVRGLRAPLPGDCSRMGVTGFSMGITSSMSSGFSECATPPRRRALAPPPAEAEGPQHQRKAFSRFPGNGRKKVLMT